MAFAAPSLGILIAGQVILGTGAAALMPASLALISHAYPDDRRRARAIGIFASASAVSIGLGPVLGGLLIDAVGWRAIFAMDAPLAVFVAILVVRGVDETPRRPAAGIDLPGQVTAIVALGAFTYAIIDSGAAGLGRREHAGGAARRRSSPAGCSSASSATASTRCSRCRCSARASSASAPARGCW